ncbi:putative periplasmic lipoprotein [Mucilaginibacter agri]|uniref:Uncharacterized protein n=1 Tax=Mucilaginibacter agri TaxID=2695265 RepID=A0A965ZGL2_9SPHI|nr:hypothetical protein [Mucilaginibacter agri]NCD70684.1 hypothetical protein [Mucilaginibacter agri]
MRNLTYLLILVLFLAACRKGDVKPLAVACADTLQHDIVSVSGPTKTTVNKETTFDISWKAINGCDQFVNLTQDSAENLIYIKAFASHDSCSVCETPASTYKTASYKFKATKAGTYYLKFYKSGSDSLTIITDTLLVE